ncbi:MAG: hypothetical protein AAF556_10675, partial [Pseudomonadota bacterium]
MSEVTEQRGNLRSGLLAGGAILVPAAIGLVALKLASGPEAGAPTPEPTAVVEIDPAVIGPDAPVYPLGPEAEDGSWRQGTNSRVTFGADDSGVSEITLQAADFEPGRYHFPRDVVIQGEFTQAYVEITAGTVTFEGDINTDHVRVVTLEGEEVWRKPDFMEVRHHQTSTLTGFESFTPRGDIAVNGSVRGNGIEMIAGRINITGDAEG